MMTFLKTILIFLLIYFGFKFLIKLAWPYIMRYITKKAGQKFQQAFGNASAQNVKREKEGSVTLEKVPNKNGKSNQKVGEYVDYEEVD